jgi:hypothetical protein
MKSMKDMKNELGAHFFMIFMSFMVIETGP